MTFALKEWPAVIQALGQGENILLIRKGGIHDKGKQFTLPSTKAFLFPAFEHQDSQYLKDKTASALKSYQPGERLLLHTWVEFVDNIEVQSPEIIPALNPHHMWTNEFIQQRYHWKPQRPLFCVLCRAYQFTKPTELIYQSKYGGCKSYMKIDQQIPEQWSTPVLSTNDFREKVKQIQSIFHLENTL